MPRIAFDLTNLDQVDFGKAAVAFRHALERVVRDCLDRPADQTTRKVVLEMEIKPRQEPDGDCVECECAFKVQAKTPPWQTAQRPYNATKQGHLFFNPDAPENPNQSTFGALAEADEDDAE